MIGRKRTSEQQLTFTYDVLDDIPYADWTGDQTRESVMDGCEKILHYLSQQRCDKVLNDNTNVTNIWSETSEWVARGWFPNMHKAGCNLFSWVYSPMNTANSRLTKH